MNTGRIEENTKSRHRSNMRNKESKRERETQTYSKYITEEGIGETNRTIKKKWEKTHREEVKSKT